MMLTKTKTKADGLSQESTLPAQTPSDTLIQDRTHRGLNVSKRHFGYHQHHVARQTTSHQDCYHHHHLHDAHPRSLTLL